MSRLSYTRKGFLRRVAMSRDALFLIVEGIVHDCHYYGKLCEGDAAIRASGYQVWPVQQIHGSHHHPSGGKLAVCGLYDYYRRQGRLRQQTPSGVRSIAFALDADLDPIAGTTRRSPHVVYTTGYDVESDVFRQGDDAEALALALSLDPPEARRLASLLGSWIDDLAQTWREWLTLCCVARLVGTSGGVSPSRPSWINKDRYGSVDPAKLGQARKLVEAQSTCSAPEFSRRSRRALSRASTYYSRGHGGHLISGKLLVAYLESLVRQEYPSGSVDLRDFASMITKSYLASLDYDAAWASDIRDKLRALT